MILKGGGTVPREESITWLFWVLIRSHVFMDSRRVGKAAVVKREGHCPGVIERTSIDYLPPQNRKSTVCSAQTSIQCQLSPGKY